jgi:hypothetical protein
MMPSQPGPPFLTFPDIQGLQRYRHSGEFLRRDIINPHPGSGVRREGSWEEIRLEIGGGVPYIR